MRSQGICDVFRTTGLIAINRGRGAGAQFLTANMFSIYQVKKFGDFRTRKNGITEFIACSFFALAPVAGGRSLISISRVITHSVVTREKEM